MKTIGFSAFCLLFNTNSFAAYSDAECFGGTDGVPFPTANLTIVDSSSEVAYGSTVLNAETLLYNNPKQTSAVLHEDGIIKCTGTTNCTLKDYKSSGMDENAYTSELIQWIDGMSWSVNFQGKGTVSGYAFCGPSGWSTDKQIKTGKVGGTYSGCGCTITDFSDENTTVAQHTFVVNKYTQSSGDWQQKTNDCRSKCPALCANRIATDSAFRQILFQECPVFETGGGTGGEDTPTQIHCDAGSYLPAGATTCQTCDGTNNYCEGGDFYQDNTQNQGIAECPFGFEPNNSHSACSPLSIICEAGEYLPATKTICEKCKDNYYCEEDIFNYSTTENQGLKTCEFGYEPNSGHTACQLKSIHCGNGYYLPKNSLTCTACIGFEYCPENTYNFSASDEQGKNICGAGTVPNENHSACIEKTIVCPAGKYLPNNSHDEYDCQWCPDPYEAGDYYYCPGGEYDANYPSNNGMNLCPEYSYSEEESSYCTCNEGYTTDGKTANASNKTTTTTACVPEGSAVYNASYYCDTDTESLGSATISVGSLFTLISNIDFDNHVLCEKSGYDFGGWRDEFGNEYSAGDSFTWNYETDVRFTAIWNQKPVYTVSYSCGSDATGGYAPDSDDVVSGDQYTTRANTCEKTGNNFLGWVYNDDDLYEAGETFTYNYNSGITLVPLWEEITITCQPGFWATGNATTCDSECLQGYYCGGETYKFDGQTHGLTKCDSNLPSWASAHVYSEFGATSENDCRISVAMGVYADEDGLHQCEEMFYCPGFSGSVVEFNSALNNSGFVGLADCSDAPNYKDWGWTHGITSAQGSTSVNDCKIIIAPATYMDTEGVLHQCPADHFCPGHTYEYIDADTFFVDLVSLGAGIYECPVNATSDSGSTSCHCADGYMLNTDTGMCTAECGAGFYLPTNANACIEVGAGYYSPNGDSERYKCPDYLTTTGSGIGADEYSDCGRTLHIGNETLRMRSVRKTTPSLNVKIGNAVYYGDMTLVPTNINANTTKKLRVKYGNVEQYVHDTTID